MAFDPATVQSKFFIDIHAWLIVRATVSLAPPPVEE